MICIAFILLIHLKQEVLYYETQKNQKTKLPKRVENW